MGSTLYVAEVKKLSKRATKDQVHRFFSFCGRVLNVEIIRLGRHYQAYVTFPDFLAREKAVLLTGSRIADKSVEIVAYNDDYNTMHADGFVSTPTEAVVMATEMVRSMKFRGYKLGKGVYEKAKEFDKSYGLTARTATTVSHVSQSAGIADTLRAVDAKYGIYDKTSRVARTTTEAASTVVNSRVVKQSALLLSGVLGFAAKTVGYAAQSAAEFGNRR